MKINNTPVTLVLLVFSWLIAIFGVVAGIYFIISNQNDIHSLIRGFLALLGSFLLAAVVRCFGNIGQILNDLSHDSRTIKQELAVISQGNQEAKETLSKHILNLNQEFKGQLLNLSQVLKEQIHALSQGNQEAKETLSKHILNLNQDLKEQIHGQTGILSQASKEASDSLSEELSLLNNSFEQVSSELINVAKNINQIKSFFEKIEKHLDLKK